AVLPIDVANTSEDEITAANNIIEYFCLFRFIT
ncbi:MAG: hypothetical protein K0S67_1263, partial [Nitrososphaeraceae archaeon]|nr:hypothetical protein [Nitrososphaeraceae archaeon]